MTDRSFTSSSRADGHETPSVGVGRRHVVQGAAWSLPVIMLATTAPAYAASAKPVTLAFNQPTFTAKGCAAITGATVTATVDSGVPQAGVSVSVLLPTGYTFADGSTTFTGVTNGSGVVSVPAVTTPASGGKTTLTALAAASGTTGSGTASSQMEVSPGISGYAATNGSQGTKFSSVPVGAVPLGSSYFLAGSDLFFENTKVASGVISASVYATLTSAVVSYNTNAGGNRAVGATIAESYSGVPTSARSVGADYYLTAAGELFYKGSRVATDAQSAVGAYRDSHYTVDYIDANNAKRLLYEGVEQGAAITYPQETVPVKPLGLGYFLTNGGDLYSGNRKVASGVLSAATCNTWDYWSAVYYVTTAGGFMANNGVVIDSYAGLPANARSVAAHYYLTPSGDLYYRNRVIASGVASAVGSWQLNHDQVVYVTKSGDAYWYGMGTRDAQAGVASGPNRLVDVPAISYAKPLGLGYFLTGEGDLYSGNSKVASGVLSAATCNTWDYWSAVYYVTTAGGFMANNGVVIDSYAGLPANARSVAAHYYLTPSGDLYYRNRVIASGVASAAGSWQLNHDQVVYVTKSGDAYWYGMGTRDAQAGVASGPNRLTGVPSGAVPVGNRFLLTPAGDLYVAKSASPSFTADQAIKTISGVASASGWVTSRWVSNALALSADGTVRKVVASYNEWVQDGWTISTWSTKLPGGRVVNGGYALSSTGDLYYNGAIAETGVYDAAGEAPDSEFVCVVYKSGKATYFEGAKSSGSQDYSEIPRIPVPIGNRFLLTPAGDLYVAKSASPSFTAGQAVKTISGVSSALGWVTSRWVSNALALSADGTVRKVVASYNEWVQDGWTISTWSTKLPGGRVVNGGYALSSTRDLYYNDAIAANGVYDAAGEAPDSEYVCVVYTNGDATYFQGVKSSGSPIYSLVKNAPISVGAGFALTPAGNLYFGAKAVAGGIVQARGWVASASVPSSSALASDGTVYRFSVVSDSPSQTTLKTNFNGAMLLGGGYILSSNSDLYFNDTKVSSGVFAAEGYQRSDSSASFTKYDC